MAILKSCILILSHEGLIKYSIWMLKIQSGYLPINEPHPRAIALIASLLIVLLMPLLSWD